MALMLAGLIWRGVAFEFRFKAAETHRPLGGMIAVSLPAEG